MIRVGRGGTGSDFATDVTGVAGSIPVAGVLTTVTGGTPALARI